MTESTIDKWISNLPQPQHQKQPSHRKLKTAEELLKEIEKTDPVRYRMVDRWCREAENRMKKLKEKNNGHRSVRKKPQS